MNSEICLVLRQRSAELNTELATFGFTGHIYLCFLYIGSSLLAIFFFNSLSVYLNSLLMLTAFFYLFVSVQHFDLPLQMNGVIPINVPHLFNRPSSSTVINRYVPGGAVE